MPLTREQQLYKKRLKALTPVEVEILFGMILGDAYIAIPHNCLYPFVTFEQSLRQKLFMDHLFEVFRRWTWYSSPVLRRRVRNANPGKINESLRFRTFTHPAFTEIYQSFYPEGQKKVIPKNITSWLTPKILAYQVMCDGSYQHKRLCIHSNCFSREDNQIYADTINKLFGLHAYVTEERQGAIVSWRIFFRAQDLPRLQNLLLPHLLPFFHYKVGM